MPTLLTNYAVWPLLQVINFRFVPFRHKTPYVLFWGYLWNIYLSNYNFSANKDVPDHT